MTALFVPDYLIDTLDLKRGFDSVWLRNPGLDISAMPCTHTEDALELPRDPFEDCIYTTPDHAYWVFRYSSRFSISVGLKPVP